jgi:hypothetical protein
MLHASTRAERCRGLAERCLHLAAIDFSTETRNHFLRTGQASQRADWRPRSRAKGLLKAILP